MSVPFQDHSLTHCPLPPQKGYWCQSLAPSAPLSDCPSVHSPPVGFLMPVPSSVFPVVLLSMPPPRQVCSVRPTVHLLPPPPPHSACLFAPPHPSSHRPFPMPPTWRYLPQCGCCLFEVLQPPPCVASVVPSIPDTLALPGSGSPLVPPFASPRPPLPLLRYLPPPYMPLLLLPMLASLGVSDGGPPPPYPHPYPCVSPYSPDTAAYIWRCPFPPYIYSHFIPPLRPSPLSVLPGILILCIPSLPLFLGSNASPVRGLLRSRPLPFVCLPHDPTSRPPSPVPNLWWIPQGHWCQCPVGKGWDGLGGDACKVTQEASCCVWGWYHSRPAMSVTPENSGRSLPPRVSEIVCLVGDT